jgi:hypothetical protein
MAASIEPVFLSQNRNSFVYTANNGISSSIRLGYYLTGEDFIKKFIINESGVFAGNLGGLTFNSGFLKSYSLNGTPNSPVTVNAEIALFDQLKGRFSATPPLTAPLPKTGYVLNMGNVTVDNTNSTQDITNISSLSYQYTCDIEPIYYMQTGIGLHNIIPDRIFFGRKEITTNLICDNYSGGMQITGNQGRIKVTFNHPNLGADLESIESSGQLFQRSISTSAGQLVKNAITIKQNNHQTPPSITSLSVATQDVGGQVTIYGANLGRITNAFVGNTPAESFSSTDGASATITIPYGARIGALILNTVSGPVQTNTAFTVTYPSSIAPYVSSVNPITGYTGTTVSIEGYNFYDINQVKFGSGYADKFTLIGANQIVAEVPTSGTYDYVKVISSLRGFTGVSPAKFVPFPSLTGLTKYSGVAGDVIQLRGFNFSGTSGVFFNGIRASSFTVISNSGINAVVPTGNTLGYLTITGLSGVFGSGDTKFRPIVYISGVFPASGRPGQLIKISGSNFNSEILASGTGGYLVSFGGSWTGFNLISNVLLSGNLPDTARSGPVQIMATDGGIYASSGYFRRLHEDPVIFSHMQFPPVYPMYGISGSGVSFSIEGENLFDIQSIRLTGCSGSNIGNIISIGPQYIRSDVLGLRLNITGFPLVNIGKTGYYRMVVSGQIGSGQGTGRAFPFIIYSGANL